MAIAKERLAHIRNSPIMSRVYQKGSKSIGQLTSAVLEDAFAVAMVGMTLLGVAGVVYKSLKPEGWLSVGLDTLWEKSPGLVWFTAFSLAAVTLVVKHYYDRAPSRNRSGNLVAYAFVAMGLFFFFKLVVTGTL
jgi:hypothetical protein